MDVTQASRLPTPFVVLRSSGHGGSRWLAELLATQNMSFFFEFPGRCPEWRYPAMVNTTLKNFHEGGCSCKLDSQMARVCPPDQSGAIRSMSCVKHAFCAGRCPQRPATHCAAVGMIDSFQPAFAKRIAAARAGAPLNVVTFERDNAVKHAISKLRSSCGGTALKGNHVRARTSQESRPTSGRLLTSLMHVEPQLVE